VYLVGFIISEICHDARSHERKIVKVVFKSVCMCVCVCVCVGVCVCVCMW
jgi:hypothetical protein